MEQSELSRERKELLKTLVSLPRFLTYDLDGRGIQIKPGHFSPIFINVKSTWCYPHVLSKLTEELKVLCEDCDHRVGIETGGSPYASVIANTLKRPIILVRKESKGSCGFLAGYTKKWFGTFVIIDDVIAAGRSMHNAINIIKEHGCQIRLLSVLSYGMDKLIADRYGVEVHSLFKIEDILSVVTPELAETLAPLIIDYKNRLLNVFNETETYVISQWKQS